MTQICEQLIEIEKELSLFTWSIDGIYIWPLFRMSIYYELTRKLGVFGAPHGTSKWKGRRWRRIYLWLYAVSSTFFTKRTPKDILIFEHARKVKKNGYWVDIYSESLIEELKKSSFTFTVYENLSNQSMTHQGRRCPHQYIDPILTWSGLLAHLFPIRLSPKDQHKIQEVEQEIERIFQVKVSLQKRIAKRVREFTIAKKSFTKLLRAQRPKKVVLVVSYSHSMSPLIAAAKEEQIETIELQHGTFSPYHLGYHFPNNERVPYFCDTFFSFGPFWHKMAMLPLPDSAIKAYGFEHLNEQLHSAESTTTKDSILFLSQGVIGEGLAKYVCVCAQAKVAYPLIYKLHPSEYTTWRINYPELADCHDQGLIQVIDHHDLKLYDLMRQALCQVGVFSTAIYEGLALGCRTLLVDLPGLEYMQALIEKGYADKIETPEQLCQYLLNLSLVHSPQEQESTFEMQNLPENKSIQADQIFCSVQQGALDYLFLDKD